MIDLNKYNYILSHFRLFCGAVQTENVSYGLDGNGSIRIKKYTGNFFQGEEPFPEKIVWKSWKGKEIPFLFDEEKEEILGFKNGIAYINYDIIASAFYFLSGWQEYFCKDKDIHGRFPYKESIQHRLNIVQLPVVNYYFDILKSALEQTHHCAMEVKLWKQSPPFATFVSHDIDKCESGWKEGGVSELKKGRIFSMLNLVIRKLKGNDAWFNFKELLDIDKKCNVKATYFFLCEYGKKNGLWNADYRIEIEKMQRQLSRLEQNGHEIAGHGSFGTHTDALQFQKEIKKLKREILGNRFHFLKFSMQSSPSVLEQSGISYDATLGFAEQPGFRNGCCFPFYLYDLKRNRPSAILEIPLVLMDATLLEKKYLGLQPEEAISFITTLLDEVKKFNGLFTVLWHNSVISDYKYRGWGNVYRDLLKKLADEKTGFLCGRDILMTYREKITFQ